MPSRPRRLAPLVLASAAGGGLVLAPGGFGALGFMLFAGMAFSGLLLSRVGRSEMSADQPSGAWAMRVENGTHQMTTLV